MSTRIVHVNFDTLVHAHDARPVTVHQNKAWEWLSEQSTVTYDGVAIIVPSATWSQTTYRATAYSCTCPARGMCWHMEAAVTVEMARAEDARYDLEADNAIWQAAYDGSPAVYHAIAHHEATEAVRSVRAMRTPSAGYKSALADLMECY